ncbi:MAG: hypothetical protein U1E51_21745 [Candidatus Binatia bacterium]|nr:hypothetical protein [Candidatus Binatia bacterium]
MKNVVLVARDIAPSSCFERLAPVLQERGFETELIIGKGKPLPPTITPHTIILAASQASLVILGMSSSLELAEPEIVAGAAANGAGVPYGFYGDVRRCWGRARPGAWFEGLAENAAFYFGVTQENADAAREVFPKAQLIGTGNPLREEMAFPRLTREEVRSKLGIAPEEKLVLASGGKFAAEQMASWVVLIEALTCLTAEDQRFQLVLATHPGDRVPYAVDAVTKKEMRLYEELVSSSPILTRIVGKDVMATSDLVPGADIIVEFSSSLGIEGAYQTVPVISLGFETLFRKIERISGTRSLEAVEDGLSELVVADVRHLTGAIRKLLTPEGFAPMKARQQEVYPKPTERGAALRKMADAIEMIL